MQYYWNKPNGRESVFLFEEPGIACEVKVVTDDIHE